MPGYSESPDELILQHLTAPAHLKLYLENRRKGGADNHDYALTGAFYSFVRSKLQRITPTNGMYGLYLAEVGLYTLSPVDPQLESAWSRPLSLPLDPSRKTGYKPLLFQMQLVPLRRGAVRQGNHLRLPPHVVQRHQVPLPQPVRAHGGAVYKLNVQVECSSLP
jgi:hypothetical protein